MIKAKFNQGYSKSEISRILGIDRKTVARYVRSNQPPKYQRKKRPSKLDPYREYLAERLNIAPFTAARLLREIKALGYEGGYSILKDYVRKIKEEKHQEVFMRFETSPGLQAQVDWCENIPALQENGQKRRVHLFSMVLGYSRYQYIEFVFKKDIPAFIRCHINAFIFFGGVPAEILYDNIKTVLLKRTLQDITYHPKFLDFASYYGFVPRLCRPYRKETKGKVERPFRYVKEDFLLGREFSSLEELNRQARYWLDTCCNVRVHGTTGKIPLLRLRKENLSPLPKREYDTSLISVRLSTKDSLISYGGSRYSVPHQYGRKRLMVKEKEGELKIYFQDTLVAVHKISSEKGAMIINKKHYEGLPKVKQCPKEPKLAEVSLFDDPQLPHLINLSSHLFIEVKKRPLEFYERLIGKKEGR